MAIRAPMKMSLLDLDEIVVQDIPDMKSELVLFVGSEAIELQTKDNRIWEPVQRPALLWTLRGKLVIAAVAVGAPGLWASAAKMRVEIRMKSSHLPWAKKDQNIKQINLQRLLNEFWTSTAQELTVPDVLIVGKHRFSFELRFSVSPTAETLRWLLKELEGKKQSPMMDAPTERVVDKAIKYGAVIAELNPVAKAVVGIAKLWNEQIKNDQMRSSLLDRFQRILPLVADDVVSEEKEIVEKDLQRMFEVMEKIAEFSREYVKAGGSPAYPEKFEEMDKELTKAIEEFSHAVEALRLATKNVPETPLKAKL